MANKYTNLNDLFTAMANAIRLKNESTGTIIADNFPTEIANLKTRFDYNNQNVTVLPDHAFYGCEGLNNVDCYNLTSVGASAFEDCKNLKTVILYDGVESVGENAFKGCSEDLSIRCEAASQPETWHENWNPDNCEVVWCGEPVEDFGNIGNSVNSYTNAKLYNDIYNRGMYKLVISGNGNMKNYSYYSVPWSNYRGGIKSIVIDDSVTSISSNAFRNCTSLTSITIPDSVTSISSNAFRNCTSLTSITIPDSVTSIGNQAFYYCDSLTSIVIPDSVTSIEGSAFYNCTSLTSINIPDSVTSIGSGAFRNTPWLKAKRQENPLVIVNNILIDGQTCSGDVVIPDGITRILYGIFRDCTSLASITIPESVTSIGEKAFENCTFLTSITYTGTIAQWNAITFGTNWNNNTGNYTIHCTDGNIAKDGTITYHTTT